MTDQVICQCGCANRSGFDRTTPGFYIGRGAGFMLRREREAMWSVLNPSGTVVETSLHDLDKANQRAGALAREAGHVNP